MMIFRLHSVPPFFAHFSSGGSIRISEAKVIAVPVVPLSSWISQSQGCSRSFHKLRFCSCTAQTAVVKLAPLDMDELRNPCAVLAFVVWLIQLLLNASQPPAMPSLLDTEHEDEDFLAVISESEHQALCDTSLFIRATFLNFRLCASLNVFHDELRFWVKPRSTVWFSKFVVEQYDSKRWVSMFRMTKPAVFALAEVIRPHIERKNTKYRLAVPVLVHVACTLFKLTHGANFTICSELFAIGRSTVSKVLREVVYAINECLRHEITWPTGERMLETQRKFNSLCSLPAIAGALDGVHISISKPAFAPTDYYYFKSGGYSMNCQAVVDSEKRFLDLYVGMPGSTNDSQVLRRSSFYEKAMHGCLLDPSTLVDGFSPYIIVDSGYPLLPWLLVPHKESSHLSLAERLFNKKLKKGRCVVENAFGILKQSFRELQGKFDLQLTFLLDVVVCCAILHNILLRQSHEEVEKLFKY